MTLFWASTIRRAFCAALIGTLVCCFALRAQQTSTSAAQAPGMISGTVADVGGAVVPGAHVRLTMRSDGATQEVLSDEAGYFRFAGVQPGNFTLSISEEGLEPASIPGSLGPGQALMMPQIALRIATANAEVDAVSRHEAAEVVVKQEEKQRILGFAPNFYVSYDWRATPLDTRQKFELADRSIIDPVNIAIVAGTAAIEQADDSFPGYGSGPASYGKRFGAGFADFAIGTYLGGAILPTLFHEDPRYFYKGTGSIPSRALYAASTSVMGRTDKGKWGISYASILGDFGSGALSNLYYPASDRHGARLTLENGGLALVSDSIGNIVQELLLRHVTPRLPPAQSPQADDGGTFFRPAASQ